jgi:MoaA/NifB/PqqE/SkfB family radical SAM enzyme
MRRQASILIQRALVSGVFKAFPYLPDGLIRAATDRILDFGHAEFAQSYLQKTMISLKRALRGLNPTVKKKMNQNFFVNECVVGAARRGQLVNMLGMDMPEALVISPTMRCPLNCSGCYSAQYAKDSDLEFDVVNRIIEEAKSLGIYFFTITGGEPFVYPHIFDVLEKHDDCWFQIYTSGALLNDKNVGRLAKLGNVNLCISVEGFEEETDRRRGKGHFKKVMNAFECLRNAGVLFGFSATATRENNDLVVSDEFIEFYRTKGANFGWYFQYMPIGRSPNLDMVPTPKQRIYRFYRMMELRSKFDLFLVDFWNDGWLSGGCIAGGRGYFHINHKGDIEPCVFCQISVDNIHTTNLFDTLTKSPLFTAIRKRQPYNKNHLLPCLMIDNPDVLRETLQEANPHETCGGGAKRLAADLYEPISQYSKEYSAFAAEAAKKFFDHGKPVSVEDARKIAREALQRLESMPPDDGIPVKETEVQYTVES